MLIGETVQVSPHDTNRLFHQLIRSSVYWTLLKKPQMTNSFSLRPLSSSCLLRFSFTPHLVFLLNEHQ